MSRLHMQSYASEDFQQHSYFTATQIPISSTGVCRGVNSTENVGGLGAESLGTVFASPCGIYKSAVN